MQETVQETDQCNSYVIFLMCSVPYDIQIISPFSGPAIGVVKNLYMS